MQEQNQILTIKKLEHARSIEFKLNLGIYSYLKKTPTIKVEGMLRNRKLMYNWSKQNPELHFLKDFSKISEKCDKVHFKLTAIFTNKIFPDIMPDDIPIQDN